MAQEDKTTEISPAKPALVGPGPKLYLIDGTYELFRAYFAVPSSKNPAGEEVGAARGLLRSLNALLRSGEVAFVGVAFDHVIESFRNRLFDGYKTGEGLPEELTSQFTIAEDVTRALGIVTWPMIEFEADDALATAAWRFADEPELSQVVILSPDKDLAQCVRGDKVVMLDRQRNNLFDEKAVIQKFGVPPAAIPDYLALVGDSADGIPGVARWGARSASALLAQYGSLEQIPLDCRRWSVRVRGAEALAETLAQSLDDARLYKTLATLRRDVPLSESLEDCRFRGPALALLEEVCERVGEKTATLLSR